MKKLLLALLFMIVPALASAQAWTTGMETTLGMVFDSTPYSYSWTGTATDSELLDMTGCSSVTWTYDGSTGDASTDASFEFQQCPQNSLNGCRAITGTISQDQPDGATIAIGKNWMKIDVVTGTSGGDTALVQVACNETPRPGSSGGGSSADIDEILAATRVQAQDVTNQPCDVGNGCPDPYGPWAISQWHWGFARSPSSRPDRGTNPVNSSAWSFTPVIDSVNDYIALATNVASAYTFTLVNSEAAGQEGSIELPDGAGLAFCRDSGTLLPCTTGGTCSSVPATGYVEPIIIRKNPENRYYLATISAVTGCTATGNKTLTLSDGWPIATDNNDQVQPWRPDGPHEGTFGNSFVVQNILEARKELYFQPKKNMVQDGRMESGCAAWTLSSGTPNTGSYNPIAKNADVGNNYGSVLGNSCNWTAQAGAGATMDSQDIILPAGLYYLRWHQRTPLAIGTAVGVQLMYDSDFDGITEADFCGAYAAGGGRCDQNVFAYHADPPDISEIIPTDPAGVAPKAFYPNDTTLFDGICNDWCWNVLAIEIPQLNSNQLYRIRFVIEAATTVGIDEVVLGPMLPGSRDGSGLSYVIPDGIHNWVHTGDNRCNAVIGSLAGADIVSRLIEYMAFGTRGKLDVEMKTGCFAGAMAQEFTKFGVGCATGGCGYFSYETAIAGAVGTPPTKERATLVTTAVGIDDALSAFSNATVEKVMASQMGTGVASTVATLYPATGTSTNLVLASGAGFPKTGRIQVGNEIFTYADISGAQLVLYRRGISGTTQAAHAVGERVRLMPVERLIRETGALSIHLGTASYHGKTDGSDIQCTADALAQDCGEFTALESQRLEVLAN